MNETDDDDLESDDAVSLRDRLAGVCSRLYWRCGAWKLHRWWSHVVGGVACWWRGEHEPVWTAGSLTPFASLDGSPLPEPEHWSGSYCLHCGKSLDGEPFGQGDDPPGGAA